MAGDRQVIYSQIESEREYQDKKWGGPSHDDVGETPDTFVQYIDEYSKGKGRAAGYDIRTRLIKTAALAVAAIESIDRKGGATN